MTAGRDPHAEGMVVIFILLVCVAIVLSLACIGAWTVWEWLT